MQEAAVELRHRVALVLGRTLDAENDQGPAGALVEGAGPGSQSGGVRLAAEQIAVDLGDKALVGKRLGVAAGTDGNARHGLGTVGNRAEVAGGAGGQVHRVQLGIEGGGPELRAAEKPAAAAGRDAKADKSEGEDGGPGHGKQLTAVGRQGPAAGRALADQVGSLAVIVKEGGRGGAGRMVSVGGGRNHRRLLGCAGIARGKGEGGIHQDGAAIGVDTQVLAVIAHHANLVGDRIEGKAEGEAVQRHGEGGSDGAGRAGQGVEEIKPAARVVARGVRKRAAQPVELAGPGAKIDGQNLFVGLQSRDEGAARIGGRR
jgi:hypothetical protein